MTDVMDGHFGTVSIEGRKLTNLRFADDILLLFAMIRSIVKSFKVPDVEVVAARMCNEAALTHMTDSTSKNLGHT